MGQYQYGRFYDINTMGGHFQRSIPMRNSIAGTTRNYFPQNHAPVGGHFAEFAPSDFNRDHTTFVEYFIPRSMSDFNLSIIKPEVLPGVEGQVLQPVLKNKNGAKSGEGTTNSKMRVTFQDDMALGQNLPPPPPSAEDFM